MPLWFYSVAALAIIMAGCTHAPVLRDDSRAFWNLSRCTAIADRASWCAVRDRARSGERLKL